MNKCSVCNRKGILFTVEIENKKVQACSRCIQGKHLTGWSK
jgi:hypothetical protein